MWTGKTFCYHCVDYDHLENLIQISHFESIGESVDMILEHRSQAEESSLEYRTNDAKPEIKLPIGNCTQILKAFNAIECTHALYCAEVRAYHGASLRRDLICCSLWMKIFTRPLFHHRNAWSKWRFGFQRMFGQPDSTRSTDSKHNL